MASYRQRNFGAHGRISATAIAIVLGVIAMQVVPAQAAGVLYREIFPNRPTSSTASQEQQLNNEGWYGGNSGDPFQQGPTGGEGAISNGGTPLASELTPVNSSPIGPIVPATSFAFWSKEGVSNNFLYTTEYVLPSTALQRVEWNSRNTSNSVTVTTAAGQGGINETDTHIAVRIGNVWYVSDQGFLQSGDATSWRFNGVDIAPLTWGLFDNFGVIPDLTKMPSRSATQGSGIADLPGGTVTAFGLWWERVSRPSGQSNGTNRIDNFTLIGEIPEPATLTLFGTGLLGAAWLRRRQRKA